MGVGVRIDDGAFIGLDGWDDERPRGCQWDESVCTAVPDHRITLGGHGHDHGHDHEPEVELYCGRHYALYLARLVEVHLPGCPHGAADHVAEHGPIGR